MMKTRMHGIFSIALIVSLMLSGTTVAAAGITDDGTRGLTAAAVTAPDNSAGQQQVPAPRQKNTAYRAVGKATKFTYVYRSASAASGRVLKLGPGNLFDVSGVSGSYYRVKAAGKTGYVRTSHAKIVSGSLPARASASSATQYRAVGKATKFTYVYRSASTASGRVLKLGPGNLFDVFGVSGSYYKVKAAGKTGYVPKSHAKIVSGSVPARASAPSAAKNGTVGKAKKATYLYSAAKSKSRKLLKLSKGKKLDVFGVSGSYYKVKAAGKTGYVPKSHVSVTSGKVPAGMAKRIAVGKAKGFTYMYASGSTSSRKVLPLGKGNMVDIYANSGSYYKIEAAGKPGYAPKSKIKKTATFNSKSAATPKPTAKVTPKPTAKATPKPTAKATPKPTATATPKPTATPAPTPSDGFYTIDNGEFGIYNNGTRARATTDGINDALNWAKSKGYTKVRFAPGTYLIQCTWNNRYIAPTDGILVPSGMTLDLGTATFKMEANRYPAYTIFGIVNKSNVKITGGTLIGDLGQHTYAASSGSSTHEWGFGICVSASRNVVIDDVTIKNMTGDGVILEGSYAALSDGGRVSSNIKVTDCTISNCRRQGISVIGATDSELARNRISGISGTDPQYGIDVETEFDYVVTNLKIHHNTISGCSGGAINCNKGANYDVYSNTVTGNNIIAVRCSNVKIYGNNVKNTFIRVMPYASNVTVENNSLDSDSWVFFG
ncbi:MAG: SH3 domain-containing protein [Christensenellales bacterium]|jgi:hypothetical protein